MRKLSTGVDSTLGNWYDLCMIAFGEGSRATNLIKAKMDEQGRNAEVIAEEEQLLFVLVNMFTEEMNEKSKQ